MRTGIPCQSRTPSAPNWTRCGKVWRDITISETAPCDAIVNHEWVHTRQILYPDWAQQAYGDAFEIVADCGSKLLGSPVTPYLERRKKETGQVGCTADELDSARRALGWSR